VPSKHIPTYVHTMIRPQLLIPLFVATLLFTTTTSADLISPRLADARSRLHANPDTYDQVDQYCSGLKRDAACSLPGNAFEGGGPGVCKTGINHSAVIDMVCEQRASVAIDRQIPDGGFVADERLCEPYRAALASGLPLPKQPWNCAPPPKALTDQFCRSAAVGGACTAEVVVDGRKERHPGVCNPVLQTENFYHQGRRQATRSVLMCQPASSVVRQFSPASWLQKLKQ
jgi:hypothetical protein